MRPYRTLLEQKIRERRMTLEEFCAYAETFAREHGEPGTLSLRHLQRLVAGKGPKGQPLGPIRPATARLLERIFEQDSRELLAPPMQAIAPPDDDAAELRDRIKKSRRVDAGMLQGLRDQLNTIRRIDRQYGALVTHNELLEKIAQAGALFTHSLAGNTRQELATILSEMHSLAGWQSLDLGYVQDSWKHYEKSRLVSQECEDVSYYAHATAEQAIALIDLEEKAMAIDMIEHSIRIAGAGKGEVLQAWLAAAYGEALAAAGLFVDSLRQFDIAENHLETSGTASNGPYVVLDENHLARWRGHSVSKLGSVESIELLVGALTGLNSTFVRAESALRIDLAYAFSVFGNYAAASEQAGVAREAALRVGSVRQLKRAASLF